MTRKQALRQAAAGAKRREDKRTETLSAASLLAHQEAWAQQSVPITNPSVDYERSLVQRFGWAK